MALRVRKLRRAGVTLTAILLLYLVTAYLGLPLVWVHREHQPGLAAAPAATETPQGIPGDPLNIGLVGIAAEAGAVPVSAALIVEPDPPLVTAKNQLWTLARVVAGVARPE